jgi:hypothetical protein
MLTKRCRSESRLRTFGLGHFGDPEHLGPFRAQRFPIGVAERNCSSEQIPSASPLKTSKCVMGLRLP